MSSKHLSVRTRRPLFNEVEEQARRQTPRLALSRRDTNVTYRPTNTIEEAQVVRLQPCERLGITEWNDVENVSAQPGQQSGTSQRATFVATAERRATTPCSSAESLAWSVASASSGTRQAVASGICE